MPVRRSAIIAASMLGAVGLGGVVGAVALAPSVSGAASSPTTATSSGTSTSPGVGHPGRPPNFDPTKGGHAANGITEQLLAGDTATKVRDAALAAVPGGTVHRVETDAEGSKYEAHMSKADGTEVTVKVDATFNVTSVDAGMR